MDGISLLIDRNLIVRHIGWRNWNGFWTKNRGSARPANLVGWDVTGFFSQGEVRDTYRKLFLEVGERKRQSVKVDHRCDSPVLKRSMRLTVAAVQNEPEPKKGPIGGVTSDSEWIEPQECYRRGGPDVVLMSHGFCPPCFQVPVAEEE